MTGVIVSDGTKSIVAIFLYIFEISKVTKASPKLQIIAIKNIFTSKMGLSLKGSSGK
jgi:hypothetical protein